MRLKRVVVPGTVPAVCGLRYFCWLGPLAKTSSSIPIPHVTSVKSDHSERDAPGDCRVWNGWRLIQLHQSGHCNLFPLAWPTVDNIMNSYTGGSVSFTSPTLLLLFIRFYLAKCMWPLSFLSGFHAVPACLVHVGWTLRKSRSLRSAVGRAKLSG